MSVLGTAKSTQFRMLVNQLQICTNPASDPVLQMIDQFRTHTQLSPINMRHVFETQEDLSDNELHRVRSA
eukprot:3421877-Karenia_brevis.AAC.1